MNAESYDYGTHLLEEFLWRLEQRLKLFAAVKMVKTEKGQMEITSSSCCAQATTEGCSRKLTALHFLSCPFS